MIRRANGGSGFVRLRGRTASRPRAAGVERARNAVGSLADTAAISAASTSRGAREPPGAVRVHCDRSQGISELTDLSCRDSNLLSPTWKHDHWLA
jgi:hypothetical protein